jgi:hypothetical protein
MISGAVTIDLTVEPELFDPLDRQKLSMLSTCPDGVRVIVNIGRRRFVSQDAAFFLNEHDHRLSIEIHGDDPSSVLRYVQAARAGVWGVSA